MIKDVRVILVFITMSFSVVFPAGATLTDLQELPGLKRFNPDSQLGLFSDKDIKSVRVGQNILNAAAQLQQQGGEVHYISRGSRSRNVKISFYQPYQDSRLDQKFTLNFNKDNGFIHLIEVNYKLDSAYLDMQPVYQKIVENAVLKYGEPLLMETVRASITQPAADVLARHYINSLKVDPIIKSKVSAFFDDKLITSRTRFVESENGRAMLISGFNECYLWLGEGYAEILSLCALRKSKVNMKGQTVTMDLYNFNIEIEVENYRAPTADQLDINL